MARLKQTTIAKELRLSAGRVSQLKSQGMPVDSLEGAREWYARNIDPTLSPVIGSGPRARAVVEAVADAYDLAVARAKREHHEANLAEMRERKEAGELVEVAAVTKRVTDHAARVRQALERIPDRIAERLAAETTAAACHAVLQSEIDQVLDELTGVGG